jgi:pantothenate kinase
MKLRHVVLFGFKSGVGEAEIGEIVRRFVALRTEVPDIEALEWGVNNSPENLNRGLTHAFTLTFASAAERDAYLVHPTHAAFAGWVGAFIEAVTVFDYEAVTV